MDRYRNLRKLYNPPSQHVVPQQYIRPFNAYTGQVYRYSQDGRALGYDPPQVLSNFSGIQGKSCRKQRPADTAKSEAMTIEASFALQLQTYKAEFYRYLNAKDAEIAALRAQLANNGFVQTVNREVQTQQISDGAFNVGDYVQGREFFTARYKDCALLKSNATISFSYKRAELIREALYELAEADVYTSEPEPAPIAQKADYQAKPVPAPLTKPVKHFQAQRRLILEAIQEYRDEEAAPDAIIAV